MSLILFAIPLGSYPLVKFLDRKLNETVPRDVKQHDSPSNVQETQVWQLSSPKLIGIVDCAISFDNVHYYAMQFSTIMQI